MPATPEQIVSEIEIRQGKLEKDLEEMKKKLRAGQKISPAELEMTVKDIDRLNDLMDERTINGH